MAGVGSASDLEKYHWKYLSVGRNIGLNRKERRKLEIQV